MDKWAIILLLVIGVIALMIEYVRLSPKYQFVPPRISLNSLYDLTKEQTGKIRLTDKEAGTIGGGIGGVIGTIFAPILPITSTVLGAIAGYFIGKSFGKPLNEMKDETLNSINTEIDTSLKQIEERIAIWINKTKKDLYDAVMESFYKNSMKIAKLVGTRNFPLLEYKGKQ